MADEEKIESLPDFVPESMKNVKPMVPEEIQHRTFRITTTKPKTKPLSRVEQQVAKAGIKLPDKVEIEPTEAELKENKRIGRKVKWFVMEMSFLGALMCLWPGWYFTGGILATLFILIALDFLKEKFID